MKYLLGDLLIDTGRQSVTRSGVAIALPKLSYDVLLVLIRAAPNLVSLDELMSQVWGGVVVSPETVSKRVLLLRDALAEDRRAPRYIAGIRGRGYQIVAPLSEMDPTAAHLHASDQSPATDLPPSVKIDDSLSNAETGTIRPSVSPTDLNPPPVGRKRGRTPLAAFLGLLILVAGTAAYWQSQKASKVPANVTPVAAPRSIAVLPFTDMSENKDQGYFAEGMSEEIIDLLVKLPRLKVIGRTSSFQFKGQNVDLRTIGATLGVSYVLQGSVRKTGDRLRVTSQLIDCRDGSYLMSESYDRNVEDVLQMQDEIAAALVRALQITVGADGESPPRPTLNNPEAYALYLHGRQAYERLDQEGFEQAARDFQRSLELDPSLSSAAAMLALIYDALGEWGFVLPQTAFEQARRTAQRAIELNPDIALAHGVLGAVHNVYDWDWDAADKDLQRGLLLAPGDAGMLFYAGRWSLTIGRWDEALNRLNASLDSDPLLPVTHIAINWVQVRRGRFPEAIAAARRAIEISPTYAGAHYFLGMTLLVSGNRDEALTEFAKETDLGAKLGGLAMADWALLRRAQSDSSLAQLIRSESGVNAFGIAEVYAYRGEVDIAMHWLERAYKQKDVGLCYIKGDPPFKNIEHDPRYKAFLQKMNFPAG